MPPRIRLGYGSWRGLSTNSNTLYFADGADPYTLNTNTGAATLVGPFGSSAEMGVLFTEGGNLYGGDDTNNTVDTIDINTGAATLRPTPVTKLRRRLLWAGALSNPNRNDNAGARNLGIVGRRYHSVGSASTPSDITLRNS